MFDSVLDAASGVAYDALAWLAAALAPIDGGAAAVLAIVLFTAAVRLALHPVARRQARAQQATAALLPKIRDLRERYGTRPDRLREELADVYSTAGAGPLGGMLLALLQAPVFLVLYHTFTDAGRGLMLAAPLLGHPLSAHGLAAGWPLLLLVVVLLAVATVSARRARSAGQPRWTLVLPYLTVGPALVLPLAAVVYLTTSVSWTAVELAVLRR